AAAAQVRLASMDVISPWAKVRGSGTLALSDPPRESSAKLTIEGIDLERLPPMLKLPVRIASRGGATVDARWPGLQFEAAKFDAAARLEGMPRLAKDSLPLDASIRATGSESHVVVDVEDLRALGASTSGQVVLADRKTLSGDLRMEAG